MGHDKSPLMSKLPLVRSLDLYHLLGCRPVAIVAVVLQRLQRTEEYAAARGSNPAATVIDSGSAEPSEPGAATDVLDDLDVSCRIVKMSSISVDSTSEHVPIVHTDGKWQARILLRSLLTIASD